VNCSSMFTRHDRRLDAACLRMAQILACMCALGASACGTASVQYGQSIPTQTGAASVSGSSAAILAAAAKGNQTLALPNSRLVVVGSSAAAGTDAATGSAPPPPAGPQPAAAPRHASKHKGNSSAQPQPAQIGTQPSSQAAEQAGGKQTSGAATTPSVTTTLTSNDQTTKYAVSVVQVESSITFMVQPTNNFFSENDFGVTRLANSRIPTTVSNTFTDETASRVKTIASIAAAVAPLAAAAAPPHGTTGPSTGARCLSADLVVDDDTLKPASNVRSWSTPTESLAVSGKCLDITLTANPLTPPNLVPVATLAEAFAGKGGDWSKVWPVPACMYVTAVIKPHGTPDEGPKSATGQITVIDPDYVELMPIPKKGKITMHPICGADDGDSATDPYQADFDTINAIIAAFPAKKSGTSK
jgi:hypothetical protein